MLHYIKLMASAIASVTRAVGSVCCSIGRGFLRLLGIGAATVPVVPVVVPPADVVVAVETAGGVAAAATAAAPLWYYPALLLTVAVIVLLTVATVRTAWRWYRAGQAAEDAAHTWYLAKSCAKAPFSVMYDAGKISLSGLRHIGSAFKYCWSKSWAAAKWCYNKGVDGFKWLFNRDQSQAIIAAGLEKAARDPEVQQSDPELFSSDFIPGQGKPGLSPGQA